MNLYDIAREAGTTRTVVSLVINGKADKYRIARATQERVRTVVRRTGYVPNRFVHELFLQRRELIGVGSDGKTPLPAAVSAVATPALAAAGYQVQVLALANEPGQASSQIAAMVKSDMVAIVGAAPIPIVLPDDRHAGVLPDEGGQSAPPPTPAPPPPPVTHPTNKDPIL